MSDLNSDSNRAMSSPPARNSDHSDEDSDVIADWALVSKDGELQDTSGDDSSSISGSSIEVMSLEDDETDLDIGESSSHVTPLASEARTPMFILRVPSTEKALKALTLESEDSDESEQTEDLNVQTFQREENLQINGSNNPLFHTYTNMESSKPHEAALQGEITDDIQAEDGNPEEQEVFRRCDPDSDKSVEGEISHDVENVMMAGLVKAEDQLVEKSLDASGNVEDETKQAFRRELSLSETNESPQSSISLPELISMSELENKGEGHEVLHAEGQGHYHGDDLDPELINPLADAPGHDNDNVINQILEEGERKENEDASPEPGRRDDGEPQVPELHVYNEDEVIDNDLDLIVINQHPLPHGDQRYYYDVEQDDPETESSTEMDVHDDRIESDQSELQTTDNSNLSNVDISDLMENIRVNRQYLHHPKPWIDVFLNAALVLVISVAIGMGIGHNLGSVPSWKIGQQEKTISCHKNVDDFIHHTILDQKLDRCERKLVTREETLNKRYTKISQENQKLKDEANSLRNEVYDLRSEVIRLKYKRSQEIALQETNQKRESLTTVLVKANQLEQENSDLRLEIGRLKYGHHSNQNPENLQEEGNMDKQQEQTKGRPISSDPCSKVTTSLQHELDIERERSEMWRKLYKDQAEEMKKKIPDEGNNTQDVFGCMRLMLKNLSLPVNISMNFSKNIEEQWKKLQNVSLNSFVEILKSFVTPDNNQEKGNKWNSGHKKGDTRWSDTVKDVLNKTRESMSDVTQQIQDTWKQVKNLSQDFWKKHEPTVSEHLRKVQETMHQATQQLKDRFHKSKWFSKKRKGKKNKNNRDSRDHFERRNENRKHGNSFKASTKRRGSQEGKHKNKKQNKHLWNNNKRLNKQYIKLHDRMQKLNLDQFENLSCRKRKKTLNILNKFCSKFRYNRVDQMPGMWFSCQFTWWSNIVNGQDPIFLPECGPHLFSWQLMVHNCPGCQTKICRKSRDHDDQNQYKNEKHGRHQKKKWKLHPDQESFGNDYKFKENKDSINLNHMNKNKKDEEQKPLSSDDLPGLVFDEVMDFNKKPNLTEFADEMNEDYSECDPDIEVCRKEERNWYLRQMEQREYERHHQYTPDGKGNWMFERAEERDFKRTYPDTWYFRHLNEENKHEPPPPPKHFMMTDNQDCFEEDGHISCVEW